MELFKERWELSYARGDNAIFYPKEEVIKFLSRHVRKRTGLQEFRNILEKADGDRQPWRALDYGCGIARQAILLEEFGFEAFGVDLSERCVEMGRQLARQLGCAPLAARLSTCDGRRVVFDDAFFDISIAESCLDSMSFDVARQVIGELERVTKYLGYFSVYSGDNTRHHREFCGEEVVEDPLAQGTVRCFYNWSKIQDLLAGTRWRIKSAHLVEEQSLTERSKNGRYCVILHKAR